MSVISIGPLPSNSEAVLKLAFGSDVSSSKVIEFAKRTASLKEHCGLISGQEAIDIVKRLEVKLKELSVA